MAGEAEKLSVFTYSTFNIILSIAIVLLNKWVYLEIGFPNLTLTFLHFASTFIGLGICEHFNVFCVKSVPLRDVLPLVLSFCGFVIFTNLSLQYNTVGTYQLAKVMTTPTIAIIQEVYYKKPTSISVKWTLFLITLGVTVAVYNDTKLNFMGTAFATLGVIITSSYQILVSQKQAELEMNHMQLLYYQSAMSSVLLFIIVLLLEPPRKSFEHSWSISEAVMILLTCTVAFFLNVSIYWIIGNTSPLTYNMIGHLKFCLTTAGGSVLFKEPMTLLQITGVALTLLGVIAYGQLKVLNKSQQGGLLN